ncbi:hypothetical protein BN946_scf184985.g100 [Trametes cinnabarina]|uniref:Pinin/SDK/MemA protein domain-containing protein n=1 Tax=Pycnoporus cinnabarinus TaxID=5643 RepID=A0A060SE84_PYCCI|nr:hypothetical protein BN946_scf184985.g100 [Trametes cinnabarina]
MATEQPVRDSPAPSQDTSMQAESTPALDAAGDAKTESKKRPRIDMAVEPRERKRGKTMFGLVLGTLTKAKNEDKERNASEAARKRQLIEQRLQDKLRKETDSVRRAMEAKKDKTTANRKEEELQLKDSIHKLRRTRLPLLSNFLLTSDVIPSVDSESPTSTNPLAPPPRTRPPPIYYLPAKLLPAQEAFLKKRKAEVKEAAEKEWEAFKAERAAGVEEINQLRQRVAEEENRHKTERSQGEESAPQPAASSPEKEDAKMAVEGEEKPAPTSTAAEPAPAGQNDEAKMEVDEGPNPSESDGAQPSEKESEQERAAKESAEKTESKVKEGKEMEATPNPGPGYEDDAVEY